ncbi:hypothetical protein HMSSN139_31030 [Paenibacillus sp. HMSSN-139]|nr:hypothetical protein HMSSN139_31030 [Paenibacillus sp. HMSSN-139]
MNAHEIDYRIIGSEMQCVEVHLDQGESVIAEAGSFMMMDPDIRMETIFGDGSNQGGGGLMGKLMGAGKRLLTGEGLFMTVFTNAGYNRQAVTFASPYPGKSYRSTCKCSAGKSSAKKTLSSAQPKVCPSGSNSSVSSAPAFLAEKASLCRKSKATGWPSCIPEDW